MSEDRIGTVEQTFALGDPHSTPRLFLSAHMGMSLEDGDEVEVTARVVSRVTAQATAQRAAFVPEAPAAPPPPPLTIELRFTVGPWFETEGEYPEMRAAPVRAESASCVSVENDTARAWDWGATCDLDGYTPAFNAAAQTHKWPNSDLPYAWYIYTPNGTSFEAGFEHDGRCATLPEAQAAADAALVAYCGGKGVRRA